MSNVTISIDKHLLEAGREYARRHRTSLNNLIRKWIEENTGKQRTAWFEEYCALADKARGNSRGKKWKREDLYDV
jgi:hypothetical protein